MQLHDLTPAPGSTKNRKRVRPVAILRVTAPLLAAARRARVPALAAPRVPGFEGGQTPLAMRLPKLRASATPVVSSTLLSTLSVSSVSSRTAL